MNALDNTPTKQRGAALLISLVMLLAMTILAVTAARQVTLQERMAGNLRERSIAFEAAEAGLRQGEQFLQGLTGGGTPPTPVAPANCGSPPCDILSNAEGPSDGDPLDPMVASTWSGSQVRDSGLSVHRLSTSPRFYIQERKRVSTSLNQTSDTERVFYMVTAQAETDGGAESILRSYFVVRY